MKDVYQDQRGNICRHSQRLECPFMSNHAHSSVWGKRTVVVVFCGRDCALFDIHLTLDKDMVAFCGASGCDIGRLVGSPKGD